MKDKTEQTLDWIIEEIKELTSHPELLIGKDARTFIGGLNKAIEIIESYKDEPEEY